MAAGAVILLLGPLQLIGAIRRRWPVVHRWIGRTYVTAAGLAGIGGLVFIATQRTIGGLPMDIGFGLYGLLMVVCAVQTWRHAAARRIEIHRGWAIRLYALAIGSWLYRMDYGLWLTLAKRLGHTKDFHGPFDVVMAFAFYVPNLILAEIFIRARRAPGHPALQWRVGAGAAGRDGADRDRDVLFHALLLGAGDPGLGGGEGGVGARRKISPPLGGAGGREPAVGGSAGAGVEWVIIANCCGANPLLAASPPVFPQRGKIWGAQGPGPLAARARGGRRFRLRFVPGDGPVGEGGAFGLGEGLLYGPGLVLELGPVGVQAQRLAEVLDHRAQRAVEVSLVVPVAVEPLVEGRVAQVDVALGRDLGLGRADGEAHGLLELVAADIAGRALGPEAGLLGPLARGGAGPGGFGRGLGAERKVGLEAGFQGRAEPDRARGAVEGVDEVGGRPARVGFGFGSGARPRARRPAPPWPWPGSPRPAPAPGPPPATAAQAGAAPGRRPGRRGAAGVRRRGLTLEQI